MSNKSYTHGSIVKLAGIEFVVLDNNMPGSTIDETLLFILAVKSQGKRCFNHGNNYSNSELQNSVNIWLNKLANKGVDIDLIKPRVLDLTTVQGEKDYGSIEVKAAPLTMDEARKYADVIPNCDEDTWLVTGRLCPDPENLGFAEALRVDSNGDWHDCYCAYPQGIRPALVISSSLLDPEADDPANDKTGLEDIPTEVLLEELRRRINKNK